jgi:alkanesulfonate monooxygenase SsuD/methylene tetrahydromethanopterin reductase-like flavin-dependent oxidoreductase (luciferase family)
MRLITNKWGGLENLREPLFHRFTEQAGLGLGPDLLIGPSGWVPRLASRGQWAEMPQLITDEMMAEFVVSGTWAELPAKIKAKYAGGLLDRVSYYFPFVPSENEAGWQATLAGFQKG